MKMKGAFRARDAHGLVTPSRAAVEKPQESCPSSCLVTSFPLRGEGAFFLCSFPTRRRCSGVRSRITKIPAPWIFMTRRGIRDRHQGSSFFSRIGERPFPPALPSSSVSASGEGAPSFSAAPLQFLRPLCPMGRASVPFPPPKTMSSFPFLFSFLRQQLQTRHPFSPGPDLVEFAPSPFSCDLISLTQ